MAGATINDTCADDAGRSGNDAVANSTANQFSAQRSVDRLPSQSDRSGNSTAFSSGPATISSRQSLEEVFAYDGEDDYDYDSSREFAGDDGDQLIRRNGPSRNPVNSHCSAPVLDVPRLPVSERLDRSQLQESAPGRLAKPIRLVAGRHTPSQGLIATICGLLLLVAGLCGLTSRLVGPTARTQAEFPSGHVASVDSLATASVTSDFRSDRASLSSPYSAKKGSIHLVVLSEHDWVE